MPSIGILNDPRIKTISILRLERELGPERIASLIDDSLALLAETAFNIFKGADITIRDLRPTDLPVPTNEEWVDASGTDNTWDVMTMANNTAIDDNLCIVIWGVRILAVDVDLAPPVSLYRFTVGAAIRAMWGVTHLFSLNNAGTAAGEVHGINQGAYADSPIVVTQNQTLQIEHYTIEASTTYRPVFLGAAAERVGRTLNP